MPSEARLAFRRHIFTILWAYGGNNTGCLIEYVSTHRAIHKAPPYEGDDDV
ncbi:hypothetical protein [Neisseria uirgultaei]|uniref:hypothetical protein n=1 Tax=Neisseria uirgultaei TaxID=2830646 RepID=UPI002658016D|nr:hypothetical protein [Neisseria uirgultaei]